jgi:hypothetical protein
LPLVFFGIFFLLCFGVGLLNKSGEGIGIIASLLIGEDSFSDVLGVMDCDDAMEIDGTV